MSYTTVPNMIVGAYLDTINDTLIRHGKLIFGHTDYSDADLVELLEKLGLEWMENDLHGDSSNWLIGVIIPDVDLNAESWPIFISNVQDANDKLGALFGKNIQFRLYGSCTTF